jgi:hypothetical protein
MPASSKDRIRKEIDKLLDSGVDLDQVMVLESEQFIEFDYGDTAKCVELLNKFANIAIANATKIREARELMLTIN